MSTLTSSFTPPTTSLYQFMAIAGIVLLIAYFTMRYLASKLRYTRELEAKVAGAEFKGENERLLRKAKEIGKKIDANIERNQKLHAIAVVIEKAYTEQTKSARELLNAQTQDAVSELARLKVEQEQTQQVLAANEVLKEKSSVATKLYEETFSEFAFLIRFRVFCIGFCLTLSTLGFLLWYVKIQKWQDIILEYQATHPEQSHTH